MKKIMLLSITCSVKRYHALNWPNCPLAVLQILQEEQPLVAIRAFLENTCSAFSALTN